MKFTRAMLGFVAVPLLWAGLALGLGRRLVGSGDLVLLAGMSFAAGMVWLAFVNLCVAALRRGRPPTVRLYVLTAVIGSGVPAMTADLMHAPDLRAALELGLGVMGLALLSSVLFAAIAGLPWRSA